MDLVQMFIGHWTMDIFHTRYLKLLLLPDFVVDLENEKPPREIALIGIVNIGTWKIVYNVIVHVHGKSKKNNINSHTSVMKLEHKDIPGNPGIIKNQYTYQCHRV